MADTDDDDVSVDFGRDITSDTDVTIAPDITDDLPCVPSQEICDGEDNDCDGLEDEQVAPILCPNQNGVCAGTMGECVDGVRQCDEATYRETAEGRGLRYDGVNEPEIACDGQDNNCDGRDDERCCDPETWDWVRVDGGQLSVTTQRRPEVILVNYPTPTSEVKLVAAWEQSSSVIRLVALDPSLAELPVFIDEVNRMGGARNPGLTRISGQTLALVYEEGGYELKARIYPLTDNLPDLLIARLEDEEEFRGSHVGRAGSISLWAVDGAGMGDSQLMYSVFSTTEVTQPVVLPSGGTYPSVVVGQTYGALAYLTEPGLLEYCVFNHSQPDPVCSLNTVAENVADGVRSDIVATDSRFSLTYIRGNTVKLIHLDLDGNRESNPIEVSRPIDGDELVLSTARAVVLDNSVGVLWAATDPEQQQVSVYYSLVNGDGEVGPATVLNGAERGEVGDVVDGGISVVPVGPREFIVAIVDIELRAVKLGRFNDEGAPICDAQ